MDKRTQKQLVIGLIFVLIIGGAGYGFYDYFFIIETTCFDKVQNGREEGTDCGLLACGIACESAIAPLEIKSQKLIEVRSEDYDFVAQISNPNSLFGALRARYNLSLRREDGTFTDRAGTFYMLPGQTRYIVISGIRNVGEISNVIMAITEVEWTRVQLFEDISFVVQRKSYGVINKNGIFSELEAVILNNSDFDFDKAEVGVVLFDGNNDIVAVNRTDIRTFLSRTERHFKVSWPVELPISVRQDVEVLTNVFENSNFIRRYGTQEKFQKYY